MPQYPDVVLNAPVIAQPAITTTTFHVIQVTENPEQKEVSVFVSDGVRTFWVTILNSETYHSDWTDTDVTNGILSYVSQNYTPAS
jgi:hypothetical protein